MTRILFVFLFMLSCAKGNSEAFKDVDAATFNQAMKEKNSFLLDVRTTGEYKDAHIEGATLIPVQELEKRIAELDAQKGKTIVVYCRSGRRSLTASKILLNAGFSSVVNLKSGINGWKSQGFPVVE